MIKGLILTCCLILIPQRGLSKDKDVSAPALVGSALNDALSVYAVETISTEYIKHSNEDLEDPIEETKELIFSKDEVLKPNFSQTSRFFQLQKSDEKLKDEELSKESEVNKTQSTENNNSEALTSFDNELQKAVDSPKEQFTNKALIYLTEETPLPRSTKSKTPKDVANSNPSSKVGDSKDGLAKPRHQKEKQENFDTKPKTPPKPGKSPKTDHNTSQNPGKGPENDPKSKNPPDSSRTMYRGPNPYSAGDNLTPDKIVTAHYDPGNRNHCLTGYMTNVQNWVDEYGNLSPNIESRYFVDLSSSRDPVPLLQQEIDHFKNTNVTNAIRYISLANCNLKRVPTMFAVEDSIGRALHSTVEYLTLYGNEFSDISTAGEQFGEYFNATNAHEMLDMAVMRPATSPWTAGFQHVKFSKLKELDLRNCRIQQLNDNIFRSMPYLEALYLGENDIVFISANAFAGLESLMHLDLSRNSAKDDKVIVFEHERVLSNLGNLTSLDLSMSIIEQRGVMQFKILGKNLERLSLCHTRISQLPPHIFNGTAIKYLDLSGNDGILSGPNTLSGLESTLEVLYAKGVGLKNFDTFYRFRNLQLLNIESNELNQVGRTVIRSLKNLKILNLRKNRLTTWFQPIFGQTKLQFLSVTENNINLISEQMLMDIQNISFVGFSGNFIVCNCHSRELYELAYRNQNKTVPSFESIIQEPHGRFSFQSGFEDFYSIVSARRYISKRCQNETQDSCSEPEDLESDGSFQFFDYDSNGYKCLMVAEAKSVSVSEVDTCLQTRSEDWIEAIEDGWNKLLLLLLVPGGLLLVLIMLYIYRRNLWYFCITMRNTATLSLINNGTVVDECTIFNYDVFVSYCNEDRNWVLDHLLPHVEKDCNISVCLHERDFQVGLSILENIVSCMDRSRAIMLVISQRFLLSQWCQFEMHLAQHRLLETRREDLILVLLEEIPRRLRPTTLHYLMLTKTYIVWPRNESEYPVFWRRLMRSLVAQRLKTPDNVSLV